MVKVYSLIIVLMLAFSSKGISQCEDGRYHDIIFQSASVQSDILYGSNIDFEGNGQDLYLDIYQAQGDAENLRPLVIFAHGGSFVAGSKDGPDVVPFCNDFARMGYVTASIQYRLGIPLTFFLEQPATEAVIRGYHDMKAAIRFFRKSVAEDGNPYGIDPDQIYLAGVSAGGFITLHNAFLDEDSEIPAIVDQTAAGLMGGIEGESGNAGYNSDIQGVINIAGALADTTYMQPDDEPVLSFHGTEDGTVPFGSAVQTLGGFPVIDVDGSESVHIKAEEIGLTHCFEIYEGQDHVPHVSNVAYYDTTRAIMSNFLAHLVCPDFELNCAYTELNIVGVEDQLKNETFLIYPNPVKTEVFVLVPQSEESSSLRVYSQMGQLVLQNRINPLADRAQFDISALEDGVYIMLWSDGKKERTERLIVTH